MIRTEEWLTYVDVLGSDPNPALRAIAWRVASATTDAQVAAYLNGVLGQQTDPKSRVREVCEDLLNLLHPEVTA